MALGKFESLDDWVILDSQKGLCIVYHTLDTHV